MAKTSLPYDQVCEIIAETAAKWAATFERGDEDAGYLFTKRKRWFNQFGHYLLRKLEEAHLAQEGKGEIEDDSEIRD